MPLDLQDETLDPRAPRSMRIAAEPVSPRLTILFHSDLRRIGDSHPFPTIERGRAIDIGRDTPSFGEGPLADPCISRRQLAIEHRDGRFHVRPDPSARRPLAAFGPELSPRDVGAPLEPGSYVAIGDRVLLRLSHGATEDPSAILGQSDVAIALRRSIRALAAGTQTVLIRGETGVGKELVARALHHGSPRAAAPLVCVNCAALPENLVESELFGHARGAFSGAATAKDGLFRAAGRGTIFLDEIGELPLSIQAKLLRVLQERTVRPLGESRELPFEARVVAATNRDLAHEVAEGRFRADLYARLEAPEILVPPLRERPDDVPLLFAHYFVAQATDGWVRPADAEPPPIPLEHVLDLMRHGWPRNVRELERHVASVLASIAETGRFVARVPMSTRPPPPPSPASTPPPARGSRQAAALGGRPDVDELLRVLDAHDYVQHQVAKTLGVSRTTLDKWMRELGVRRPKDVPEDELLGAVRAHGVEGAARSLRVSLRGLRLRLAELEAEP